MAILATTEQQRFDATGAAAAFAAAERRRAALCDAKQAWLVAFDAFKAEESLRAGSGEVRERSARAGGTEERAAARVRAQ